MLGLVACRLISLIVACVTSGHLETLVAAFVKKKKKKKKKKTI
jgi:hypothetical protein